MVGSKSELSLDSDQPVRSSLVLIQLTLAVILPGTSWSGAHALPDPFAHAQNKSSASDAFTDAVTHTQYVPPLSCFR